MKEKLYFLILITTIMNTSKAEITPNFSSHFVDVSEGKMHYYEAGSGQTVVFLHGIPGSANSWLKVATLLLNDYHVIVPDLIGFGESSKPLNDYYMKAQATCLFELLKAKNINEIYLAGHDFGGPVAITFSKSFPQISINKMALMATNLFMDTPIPGPMKLAKVPGLGQLFFKLIAGSTLGFKQMYKHAAFNKTNYPFNEFQIHNTKNNKFYTYKIFLKSLSDLKTNYAEVQGQISKLNIPVLVVWGDKDPFFAVTTGERTAKEIKRSFLVVYTDTGHFIPEEQPRQLAADLKIFFSKQQ